MYTNRGDIALPVAVWLATDNYDMEYDPNTYSVTSLLQPIRSLVLSRRLMEQQVKTSVDIMDLVPSRLGSAVHTAIENAWINNRAKAFQKLNIPQHIIDRVRLNADKEDDPNALYIYVEMRSTKIIDGVTISGKFDFVEQARVKDAKTTKTYAWIKGSSDPRYALQGSMYRMLNPDIIRDDYMDVMYIFTDWNMYKAKMDSSYPQKRVMTRTLKLHSIPDTEKWVSNTLSRIKVASTLPQEKLPLCTPEELWMDAPKWAFYKDKTKTAKATKLFDDPAEAQRVHTANGQAGMLVKRESEPTFCKYCDALAVCTQAENYIAQGLLKL